ncbi:putative transcription factor & chromatin remodeling JUMONJI family [Helianthus annuus]|nr:putative transcription factor & chromatin remodeling JUMONJI family [Helianthus annuus]KAJ0822787.1 putative transcription factor & chromatin remodeling JUMONJI family [Helianthus annuus]
MPMKLKQKMEYSSFSGHKQSPKSSKSTKHLKAFHADRTNDDLEWTNQITECPVYHPSVEEFEDPLRYFQQIAPEASKYGICKIVPPLIPTAPTGVVIKKEKPGFRFTPKVQPLRFSKWTLNDKNSFLISSKSYTLRDFEVMANRVSANKYCLSGCLPSAYMEREFWLEMTRGKKGTVEYGVNVDGSAFSSSSDDHLANSKWNLKKLPRLPRSALRFFENDIPGVTDPMLYIGMLFSMFAWHVEDHYLYSINYHHCGAPKTWYGVPGSAADEFEKVIQNHVYTREILSTNGSEGAFEMLAEKTTMFSPKILLQNHVPVYKLVQLPGEFVGTFPRAYHAGFSHGFNCGEAVNFAARDWFPFGGSANERYAFLQKKPIIPYEEILCKEAMLLSSKNPKKDYTCDPDADFNRFVKGPFASLIHKYDDAISYLKSLDRSLSILSNLKESVSCSICKRDCYVAHVNCNCRVDPICVFHDKELSNCSCGMNRTLSMRGDLPKMKNAAKKFEDELSGHKGGVGGVEYVDTKIQQSNASARESKRTRKQRTCNNGKVNAGRNVNMTGKRGKSGISPRMRSGGDSRLKEVNKKCRKRAS